MLALGSVQTAYPLPSAKAEARTHAAPTTTAAGAAPAGAAARADAPARFSVISTISPGSLSAAYHAMRAQGGASAPAGDPAILSGLGIPAALTAYGEVLAAD